MTIKANVFLALAFASAPLTAATPAPAPVAPADAIEPAKLAIGRDIIAVVLPPEQREKMFANVLDNMMRNMVAGAMQGLGIDDELKSNPRLQAVFTKFMERQRKLAMDDLRDAMPGLIEAYARAYARMFSLEDLIAIRAFVQTPAGVHFVQRGPDLLGDPDVSAWQQKLSSQAAARQPGEMERFRAELMTIRSGKKAGTT